MSAFRRIPPFDQTAGGQQWPVKQSASSIALAANSAKPNANNINIDLTAISVGGQQFVPSHADACSGYTITVPAPSAIARSVCAMTVTTDIPVANAKANARTKATFFMIASPLHQNQSCQNWTKGAVP
jgi:hypothetical protein